MSLNGRLDDDELAVIPGTGVRVRRDIAPQLGAWRRAFAARFGKAMQVTDGYRPYSGNYYAQVETFLRRYKPLGEFQQMNPGWSASAVQRQKSHIWNGVRRYLLPGQAQVAFPGTSNHGWGTAVDLGSDINVSGSAEHQWAVATAPKFGMRWPSEWARAAGEWWHFEDGVVVPVSNYQSVPGALDITIPDLHGIDPLTPLEDDPMAGWTPIRFFIWNTIVFEADLLSGTYWRIASERDLDDRRSVLDGNGIPWSNHPGGSGKWPGAVANGAAFGKQVGT